MRLWLPTLLRFCGDDEGLRLRRGYAVTTRLCGYDDGPQLRQPGRKILQPPGATRHTAAMTGAKDANNLPGLATRLPDYLMPADRPVLHDVVLLAEA
ncbi:hypothetical protein I6E29_09425 [Arcanobacterium haemolyticum]|nr:hypothetical protein [Arcanobacterium haemolyticum]